MKESLLYVLNAHFLQIQSTTCLKNNFEAIDFDKKYYGGCFKSVNINEIIIENVSILQCYSDYTTIGFKSIDTLENDFQGKVFI